MYRQIMIAVCLVISSWIGVAGATVPGGMNFSVQIFGNQDDCCGFSTEHAEVVILIWDRASGGVEGDELYKQTFADVPVVNGWVSVELTHSDNGTHGDVQFSVLPSGHDTLYIQAQVTASGQSQFVTSRVKLTSVPYALVAGTVAWEDITGRPTSLDDGLQWADITTGIPAWLNDETVNWGEVIDKPPTFPPSAHGHPWDEISNKPDSYPPSMHTHDDRYYIGADIDGLLSGKADLNHEHDAVDITSGILNTDRYSAYDDLDKEGRLNIDRNDNLLTLASLKRFAGLDSMNDADFARDLGNMITKNCPPGYARVDDQNINATGYYCTRGADEMVRVGDFWVDRYENIIVDAVYFNDGKCNDVARGISFAQSSMISDVPNYWSGFGLDLTGSGHTKLFACSVPQVIPSRWMSWFQAAQVCAYSGKHLITNSEWQTAAAMSSGAMYNCNTGSTGIEGYNGADPEETGSMNGPDSIGCISIWGVFDMMGNVYEWTDLWMEAGLSSVLNGNVRWGGPWTEGNITNPWPYDVGQDYGHDATYNVGGIANTGTSYIEGAPAVTIRGGDWNSGSNGGIFSISFAAAPSSYHNNTGFRCAIR